MKKFDNENNHYFLPESKQVDLFMIEIDLRAFFSEWSQFRCDHKTTTKMARSEDILKQIKDTDT